MKILLLIVAFCFILIQSIKAQTDSLSVLHESVLTADTLQVATEKPKLKQVLLPASLITLGVISNATYINRYVQRHAYRYSGGQKLRFDDYIQYLPIASVFAYSNLGIKAKHSVKERLIVGATAYAITAALVNGVKYSVRIHRPDESAYNSFPSGHTSASFTMVYIFYKHLKKYFPAVLITSIIIAFSRLYLTVHFPSDVLAGLLIGLFAGFLGEKIFNKKNNLMKS